MKYVRYEVEGVAFYGELEVDRVYELEHEPFHSVKRSGISHSLAEVSLLCPVQPGKIIGLSNVNYHSRMKKLGLEFPKQILFFIKPNNTLIGPNQPIELPAYVNEAAHELELTLVIGTRAKFIPLAEAEAYIFGYTLANDITIRDFMVPGMPVGKAKSMDTTTPLGPCMETAIDLASLHYQMYVNDELRHDVYGSDLIYTPAQIVSELSQIMTLEPGDLIMTGAPFNNIAFKMCDQIEIKCQQIGSMINPVAELKLPYADKGGLLNENLGYQ